MVFVGHGPVVGMHQILYKNMSQILSCCTLKIDLIVRAVKSNMALGDCSSEWKECWGNFVVGVALTVGAFLW